MLEVEQKFAVADLSLLEQSLAALSVRFAAPIEQRDRYYAHPCRDFAATDEALRIRRIGQANYVTYKGPKLDDHTKTRREIELPLPQGDAGDIAFSGLLEALGFRPVAEIRKQRRTGHASWQGRDVEIALDRVAEVGEYVELELLVADDEIDSARRSLVDLARHLHLKSHERRSYLELFLARPTAELPGGP